MAGIIEYESANIELLSALDDFDRSLGRKRLQLEIVICGAFAVQLHGFSRREESYDVDSLKKIPAALDEMIMEIGLRHGLKSNWLNSQAADIPVPAGAFERAAPMDRWRNIRASLISRQDLISMKVSAYFSRRDITTKDYDDLIAIDPTTSEIDQALIHVRVNNWPPDGSSKKIINEFEESVKDVKKIATK